MFKIVNTIIHKADGDVIIPTIHVTRGDIGCIEVTHEDSDTKILHTFEVGEVVRFTVMKRNECKEVVLRKDVIVNEETDNVEIRFTSADTKIGELIDKPAKYWFEIELNPDTNPQTIIGYDEYGAKSLVLYPEGGESHDQN